MRIQVNISEEMNKRIEKLSKDYGVSKSAFCSMIVGQYVTSVEKAYDVIQDATEKAFRDEKK